MQTIEYDLEPGQTQALRDIAITEIRVIRGRLWITQYGDITDYFLGTGQAISLQGTSVVVQAERDGATFFSAYKRERCRADWQHKRRLP